MDMNELVVIARLAADAVGLDPALVCAVCEQESSWDPNATRHEPAFKTRYVDPLGLSEPEATYRSTSYGLMQVMGQVAREFGFIADIPTLCDPRTGVTVGCMVLQHKLGQMHGDVTRGLLRYNGGGNPNYAAEVMARMSKYRNAPPAMGVETSTDGA